MAPRVLGKRVHRASASGYLAECQVDAPNEPRKKGTSMVSSWAGARLKSINWHGAVEGLLKLVPCRCPYLPGRLPAVQQQLHKGSLPGTEETACGKQGGRDKLTLVSS